MNHKPILDFFQLNQIATLELELGADIPTHIGESNLTFGIFDGFALAIAVHESTLQFIKLTYPKCCELNACSFYRDKIREHRFANSIKSDCELFPEDGAVVLGQPHEVTLVDFENSLKTGLKQIGKALKHLHIFNSEDDFLAAMDGVIYGVADSTGKIFCEIHKEQYISLTDQNILIDLNEKNDHPTPIGMECDLLLAKEADRLLVYNQRIEIIILT